ncbi:MAG TPA: adenylate/guanylate cyclase domain-containing protein [Geminicoccaceae bacterium]|nr:adenylate/guanylate cyclase domain-containing protein [Geminicoccaceae bacterium]
MASEAERRQLTVLFCDLVGSTELSARLDPEDMGAVIRAYQECCAESVKRWDGHIAKYMGDGVLVYFGYPQAHEDDAERAVRAGLALTQAVGKLTMPASELLAARVGIATGLVMVGELIGQGAAMEQTVVGETPNLAARLQVLAEPGSVVIGETTRRLVGGLFELEDLGPRRLKGFAQPLAAFQVVGEGRAEGRFEALHGEHLTPLVGREHELGILLERWAWAKDGDGQVVLLSGEPGIGKSRMIRVLRERLGDEPYTPLSHYGSPYHTNSALHPVIDLLERAMRLDREEPPEEQLARLEALLARASDQPDEVGPLFAALLGIPTGDRYPALTLPPEVQKRRTLQALIDRLAGLAIQQPVLALYEDAHWLDPSTLELLGLVIERSQRLPVLVLITFRPEFQPPWARQAHVTALTMSRLGRCQGADLVARVTGGKALPGEVLDQIVARTDGVPLFVEELTKGVLESSLLADKGDRYELSGPLPPLAIPTTLHDSLMARLDRLAPVKEVAQIGAVIGREFSHELLAAVVPMPANLLSDALEQLVSSELVFRRGTPPEARYSFKHALVQDAAYQSLLKSKRQQLHARIAEVLEQQFPDAIEAEPEVLARHLTDAGLLAPAVPYWRCAGELAAGRSANLEAIAHLSKGLELIGMLPGAAAPLDEELAVQLALAAALATTRGYATAEVEETYNRAWTLCNQLGRSSELFPIVRGLWNWYLVGGDVRRVDELSERLVVLAEERGVPLHRALGRHARGTALSLLGRFADAATALDEAIGIDDEVAAREDPAHLLVYPERAGVVCRLWSAWILWFLGFPDRALATVEAGLVLARCLAHANSLAFAHNFAAILHIFRRELARALSCAETSIELSQESSMPQRLAAAMMCRGFARVGLGQPAEGIVELRAGLVAWNAKGSRFLDTQWLGLIADAQVQAGQFDDALATLDQAAETAAATGECHYQAELYRLRGAALAGTGKDPEAASWFQKAIDTARGQQAKSLELRAAASLARLWAEQGKRAQAHGLLAPVYGWFTEGFDTQDLKDAKGLLDELAQLCGEATGTPKEAGR